MEACDIASLATILVPIKIFKQLVFYKKINN